MRTAIITLAVGSLLIYAGCSNNSAEDPAPDCSQSDLEVSVTDSTNPECNVEGSITVAGSGGTSPYTYSINGVDFQSSGTFTGLSAGNITITVEDADGCTSTTLFTLTAVGNGISVDAAATNSECTTDTGTITVTASGGNGTLSYSLDGGAAQTENTFNSLGPGSYEVVVTDGDGCSASVDVVISTNVSLSADIMPILEANCLQTSSGGGGCHNGDNGASRNWTVKSNILTNASGIKSRTTGGSMPPSSSGQELTAEEIALIACWVDDGAKDN